VQDRGAESGRWLRAKSAGSMQGVGGDANEFSSISCPELWESLSEEGVPVPDDPSVFRLCFSPSPLSLSKIQIESDCVSARGWVDALSRTYAPSLHTLSCHLSLPPPAPPDLSPSCRWRGKTLLHPFWSNGNLVVRAVPSGDLIYRGRPPKQPPAGSPLLLAPLRSSSLTLPLSLLSLLLLSQRKIFRCTIQKPHTQNATTQFPSSNSRIYVKNSNPKPCT
jgi:hypothetical protein